MPAIYSLVQDHISKPEEDNRISQVYSSLAHITQTQFGISAEYQDEGIAPYYAAVACMKSITLSILPSRKIHAIVSAAQCVFRKLNELSVMERSRPPGAGIWALLNNLWVIKTLRVDLGFYFQHCAVAKNIHTVYLPHSGSVNIPRGRSKSKSFKRNVWR